MDVPWKVTALIPVALLASSLAMAAIKEPVPQRVHFEKGKSSAAMKRTLKIQGDDTETHEYKLRAAAGQVLTVRFEAADPAASYSVLCPGNGGTDAKGKAWSLTLPESGDYTIYVYGYGAKASFPYTLEVGIEGKPHPVEPQGLTGTWALVQDPDSTIEIRESPAGKLRFAVHALWKGANWKEYGPNIGDISGTVDLQDGKTIFKDAEAECTLEMTFRGGKLEVVQGGSCGFGHNVSASGTYQRTSLCAAPERAENP